jgi:WD40 repeat protein
MSFGVAADGSVLTVGTEGDLRLWNPESDVPDPAVRLPVVIPREWDGFIRSAISPDAKRIACNTPEAVVVFEWRGNKPPVEVAKFQIARADTLTFSPDGTTLAVVTGGGVPAVHLCDLKGGTSRVVDGLKFVKEIALSADGRRVAVNTWDEFLIYEARSGKELTRWSVDGHGLAAIAWNGGDVVAARLYKTATEEYLNVRFFDAKSGKERTELTTAAGGNWVTFAPDGKTVLVCDTRGIRWWNPAAGKVIRQFDGASGSSPHGPVPAARFTPDGKALVATSGRVLFRWNAKTGEPLFHDAHAGAHFNSIMALGVSPDGTRYATGTSSRIRVWDARTGRSVATLPGSYLRPQNLEFAPDGKTLFAPDDGSIVQWDVTTGKKFRRFVVDPKEPRQTMTIGLCLSRDGKVLSGVTLARVRGTYTPVFTTWDAGSGQRQFTKGLDPFEWNPPRYRINFSPDALHASIHGDVFLTADGPTKGLLPPRTLGAGFDVGAFSGDGGRIAFTFIQSGDPVGVMRGVVHGTATGVKLCDLPAGSGGRVALNTDGSVLAAAGRTDLTFWDTHTGKLLARYKSPPAEKSFTVYSFAEVLRFTPDGAKLITGHADTTALVWPVPAGPAK